MDKIDPSETLEAIGNDKKLLGELFSIFLNQCPCEIAKIKNALASNDGMLAHKFLHKLKGSLSILGAKEAHAIVAKMDNFCKKDELSSVINLLPLLDTELHYIKVYYENFLSA